MPEDWSDIQQALAELIEVAEAGDLPDVARTIRGLASVLEQDQISAFERAATSGDLWGHMGSLFDNGPSDASLDRRYSESQRRLADALRAHGFGSRDIEHHFGRDPGQVHWPPDDNLTD